MCWDSYTKGVPKMHEQHPYTQSPRSEFESARALQPIEFNQLSSEMAAIIERKFTPHPFSHGISRDNVEGVLREYLTMSAAFPYLQAGAHHRLISDHLARGEDIPESTELTGVVGSFLFWDELGGHAAVMEGGIAALPRILETERAHANMLRKDIEALLGKKLRQGYSRATRNYLSALEAGLGSPDPVERVAFMVAFEQHAGTMIEALWRSINAIFQPTDDLIYFETHVGGDDPAEAYHIAMTTRMIERIVDSSETARFLESFYEAYRLNIDWCASIKIR
jgi:hypothetical protein